MSTNKYYYDVDKCCMVNNPPPISKNLLNVDYKSKKKNNHMHIIHKTDTYYDMFYNEGDMCDYKYSTDKTLTNLSYSERNKKVHIL
jgi:hypothetical protein